MRDDAGAAARAIRPRGGFAERGFALRLPRTGPGGRGGFSRLGLLPSSTNAIFVAAPDLSVGDPPGSSASFSARCLRSHADEQDPPAALVNVWKLAAPPPDHHGHPRSIAISAIVRQRCWSGRPARSPATCSWPVYPRSSDYGMVRLKRRRSAGSSTASSKSTCRAALPRSSVLLLLVTFGAHLAQVSPKTTVGLERYSTVQEPTTMVVLSLGLDIGFPASRWAAITVFRQHARPVSYAHRHTGRPPTASWLARPVATWRRSISSVERLGPLVDYLLPHVNPGPARRHHRRAARRFPPLPCSPGGPRVRDAAGGQHLPRVWSAPSA